MDYVTLPTPLPALTTIRMALGSSVSGQLSGGATSGG